MFPHSSLSLILLITCASWGKCFGAVGGSKADPSEAAKEMSDVGAESLPDVDLVIVVPSHSARDAEARVVIRETWAQYMNNTAVNCTPCANHTVKVVFVVGNEGNETEIESEVKKFEDVGVLEDFAQPEHRGDAEMTQRAIRFAVEHYKFKLLLKADMQAWVFMDRLLHFLDQKNLFHRNASLPGVYVGNFAGPQSAALLDDGSPDESFISLTGSNMYPTYGKGAGFLLSPDLCEFVSGMGAASEDLSGAPTWGSEYGWAPVPRLVSLSDDAVAMGFWLMPVNHTKFQMTVATNNESCAEALSSEIVLDYNVGVSQMRQRWHNMIETGNVCTAKARRVLRPKGFLTPHNHSA